MNLETIFFVAAALLIPVSFLVYIGISFFALFILINVNIRTPEKFPMKLKLVKNRSCGTARLARQSLSLNKIGISENQLEQNHSATK